MNKPTLMLATWPDATGYRYFGASEYAADTHSHGTWLTLRMTDMTDSWTSDTNRLYNNIGIYVWFAKDCIHLQLKLHDLHSADVAQAEQLVRNMKRLNAKASKAYPKLGDYVKDTDIYTELTKLLAALGITEAVKYGTTRANRYEPVGLPIAKIAATLDAIRARMT